MNRILVPQQVADAAAHNRPRGNLSDLYPRWLGARELLRHGRNPYSAEITREIQQGYYGRPIDPARPDDPRDEQGFAYPVYVVFLMSPVVDLPFETVRVGFRWLLIALVVGSVFLWFRLLHWRAPCGTILIATVLTLGFLPVVQAIKLQQLTLLVMGLFAACGVCLVSGWLFLAGGLLAFATIKPQLAWPLVLLLLFWAFSDWRSRRRFVYGFGLIMLLLLIGAEFVLPGWQRMFLEAVRRYHVYTHNESVLVSLFGRIIGHTLEAISFVAAAACLWRIRRGPASGKAFGRAFALILALTVVIIPMSALYNQALLVPAILALVWSETTGGDRTLPAVRLARFVGGLVLAWPWIATVGLSLAYVWISPELRQRVWPMPFYSSLMLPPLVFGLALLDTWMIEPAMIEPTGLRDGATAE